MCCVAGTVLDKFITPVGFEEVFIFVFWEMVCFSETTVKAYFFSIG